MTEFTHINQQGHAKVVDVSDKQITKRTAVARSSITVNETIYKQISNNTNTKGNVSEHCSNRWYYGCQKYINNYSDVPSITIDWHRCSLQLG